MKKLKIAFTKVGKYFRETSIVVIGVAITLSVSYWIANRSEERNLELYLNAIKIELEKNAIASEIYANAFQKSVKYANYINSHDDSSINMDSIYYYAQSDDDGIGWGLIQPLNIYSKNAFEMFITSGAMRQVADKELLMSIWRVYDHIDNTQRFFDMCFQRKGEESTREWYLRMERKQIVKPMQLFFSYDFPHRMVSNSEDVSKHIREVLSKLEEK